MNLCQLLLDDLTPWADRKCETASHFTPDMDKSKCPKDLVIEIIHKFAEIDIGRTEWLRLRLVNSMCQTLTLSAASPDLELTMFRLRAFQQACTLHRLCARPQDSPPCACAISSCGILWYRDGMAIAEVRSSL